LEAETFPLSVGVRLKRPRSSSLVGTRWLDHSLDSNWPSGRDRWKPHPKVDTLLMPSSLSMSSICKLMTVSIFWQQEHSTCIPRTSVICGTVEWLRCIPSQTRLHTSSAKEGTRAGTYTCGTCTCSARFRCWCGFEGLLSYEEWGLRQQIVQLPPNKRCSVSDLQCFLLTMSISIHTNRIPKLLTAVYQYTASTLDAFVLTKLSLKQS
jgi:hypothetical protein